MYRKEPIYALDDLKRTYYIMIAIIFNLSTLMADLSQEIKADQNTQLLWCYPAFYLHSDHVIFSGIKSGMT